MPVGVIHEDRNCLQSTGTDYHQPKVTKKKSQHTKIKTQLGIKPCAWYDTELDRLSDAKEISSEVTCDSENCVCLYNIYIYIY